VNLVQHGHRCHQSGAIYALAALGVGLIFSVMNLINFAHGELITAAAFTVYALDGQRRDPFGRCRRGPGAASPLVMEARRISPARNESATLLVTSFAVSYLVQHLVVLIFGAADRSVMLPELSRARLRSCDYPARDCHDRVTLALLLDNFLLPSSTARIQCARWLRISPWPGSWDQSETGSLRRPSPCRGFGRGAGFLSGGQSGRFLSHGVSIWYLSRSSPRGRRDGVADRSCAGGMLVGRRRSPCRRSCATWRPTGMPSSLAFIAFSSVAPRLSFARRIE